MGNQRFGIIVALAFVLACSHAGKSPAHPVTLPSPSDERAVKVHSTEGLARGRKWAVATQGSAATRAAEWAIRQGGNLMDAAIAASFTISVERPHSTGLGGGGFLVHREGKSGKVTVLDFRERAPRTATSRMYLDARGEVIPVASSEGPLSIGVPGLVAGLEDAHRRWGRLPWARVLEPAIRLAREGFSVYPGLAHALQERQELLAKYEDSRRIFLKPDGKAYGVGEMLVQEDLARSLEIIAKGGAKAFYRSGPLKRMMVSSLARHGALLRAGDFEGYRVKSRNPLRHRVGELELITMPPPSSGGLHVAQIVDGARRLGVGQSGMEEFNVPAIHRIASAMQMAFADRAEYLGDPDYVKVPIDRLLGDEYLERRSHEVGDRARHAAEVHPGLGPFDPAAMKRAESHGHPETTHLSLMNAEGDAIVSTQTINDWMGSGIVAEGTGIVMNDEMDDFVAKAGVPNIFGAVGGEANAVAPGKTPLSSMSPTLVIRGGKPVLALGAPGGTRIISCVALTLIRSQLLNQPLDAAVGGFRFHHQWLPDRLAIETVRDGRERALADGLRALGYEVRTEDDAVPCRVMAVERQANGEFVGMSDPRDVGMAAAQ